jgi:SAM-dependent methyltransferase
MCPLCKSPAADEHFKESNRTYPKCPGCGLVFLDPCLLPSPKDERERYLLHRNSAANTGYVKFLQGVIGSLIGMIPSGARGLDYGSGPEPVLAYLLRAKGFEMRIYDPFFAEDSTVLGLNYDFVTCVETAEHFHRPIEEFERINGLLNPGGILCVSTGVLTDDIDFGAWHYRRDFTHVSFYTPETLKWIAERFGWSMEIVGKNVIVFQKP